MREKFLDLLICPQCQKTDLKVHSFQSENGVIKTGLILCAGCRSWYPVVDFIPVVSLDPALLGTLKREIPSVWGHQFDFSKLRNSEEENSPTRSSSAFQEQIAFYDHEAVHYDGEITDTTFWRSVTNQTVCKWGSSRAAKGGLILEVGCGTGATTAQLAKQGHRLVALDICLTAAKRAYAKIRELSLDSSVDFIVCEAETAPFRRGVFDAAVFSGVLHHVSNPPRVLTQISKSLVTGGVIFGYENNASAFRFLFDLLMKIKQLWHEEAGAHPVMEADALKEWGRQAGLHMNIRSSVFLPPHFFENISQPAAEKILVALDRFFGLIPWFKDQGGLLIISGTKISDQAKVSKTKETKGVKS